MKADRKEQSRKTFDQEAEAYDTAWMYGQVRSGYQHVLREAVRHEFRNCLDVGCGTGALLSLIAQQRNGALLYGVDLSQQMIRVARARLAEKATLVVGDSERLPFEDGRFDLVTCTFSFHHYPNPGRAAAEMRRVLAPHGRLIIADAWIGAPLRQLLNLLMPLTHKGDVRIYSRREMRDIAESAGLKDVTWSRIGWQAFLMVAEGVEGPNA